MLTPKEKGDALEHAVQQIEEVMHKAVPDLKGVHATIERNRHIKKNGVSYQNDLLITIAPGTLYESVHVIECKNWNKPVGTDEVFKLRGKMEELQLASGTIIAREFTRDAEALAAESRSLGLHHFSDNFWSVLDSLTSAAFSTKTEDGAVTVHFRDATWAGGLKLDSHSAKCRYRDRRVTWDAFISALLERHFGTTIRQEPRFSISGTHSARTSFGCSFEPGEFFINDLEVAGLSVWMVFSVEIHAAKVSAKFDVEHRGGFIRLEYPPGTFGFNDVALEIVTKPSVPFKRHSSV